MVVPRPPCGFRGWVFFSIKIAVALKLVFILFSCVRILFGMSPPAAAAAPAAAAVYTRYVVVLCRRPVGFGDGSRLAWFDPTREYGSVVPPPCGTGVPVRRLCGGVYACLHAVLSGVKRLHPNPPGSWSVYAVHAYSSPDLPEVVGLDPSPPTVTADGVCVAVYEAHCCLGHCGVLCGTSPPPPPSRSSRRRRLPKRPAVVVGLDSLGVVPGHDESAIVEMFPECAGGVVQYGACGYSWFAPWHVALGGEFLSCLGRDVSPTTTDAAVTDAAVGSVVSVSVDGGDDGRGGADWAWDRGLYPLWEDAVAEADDLEGNALPPVDDVGDLLSGPLFDFSGFHVREFW